MARVEPLNAPVAGPEHERQNPVWVPDDQLQSGQGAAGAPYDPYATTVPDVFKNPHPPQPIYPPAQPAAYPPAQPAAYPPAQPAYPQPDARAQSHAAAGPLSPASLQPDVYRHAQPGQGAAPGPTQVNPPAQQTFNSGASPHPAPAGAQAQSPRGRERCVVCCSGGGGEHEKAWFDMLCTCCQTKEPKPVAMGDRPMRRLLLLSTDGLPGAGRLTRAARDWDTAVVAYDPAGTTLAEILDLARAAVGDNHAIESIGLLAPRWEPMPPPSDRKSRLYPATGLRLTGAACAEGKELRSARRAPMAPQDMTEETLKQDGPVRDFWLGLKTLLMPWARIHLLTPHLLGGAPINHCLIALRDLTGHAVSAGRGNTLVSKFKLESTEGEEMSVAGLYFRYDGLREWVDDPYGVKEFDLEREGDCCCGPCAPDAPPIESEAQAAGQRALKNARLDQEAEELIMFSKQKRNTEAAERFLTSLGSIINLYAITVGSMLVVFVPQRCHVTRVLCSLHENVQAPEQDKQGLLALNAFTLFGFLIGNLLFFNREHWMINHLDRNTSEAYDAITKALPMQAKLEGPSFRTRKRFRDALRRWNLVCYSYAIFLAVLMVTNFMFSATIILVRYYDGFRTVQVLVTNTLLGFNRLRVQFNSTRQSYNRGLAISTAMLEPVSFNVIDADYFDAVDGGVEARGLEEEY